MTLTLELVAVAAIILLNAFFVAAEYGLVTVRRTRLAELEQQGDRRARSVLRITGDPPHFIAAMQLGVTLTSLAIGAIGESALTSVLDPWMATLLAVIIAFAVITFFHVVIGELVPKGVALTHPEKTALSVSSPVRGFFVVMKPFIWVLQRSTELVLNWLGIEADAEGRVHSEAELRMLLGDATERGEIEPQEQEMLYKVFDFADKEASDVMVPRPEVVALSIDLPPEEALAAVIDSPYTRYPVYRGSLDEIVGILHVRDLFSAMHDVGLAAARIEDMLRPAYMIPETKDLAALLAEFRRTKQHMAIVVDEYGAMDGICTLEDLLEEIVGEIADEYDLPEEDVEQVDDHTIRIDGTFPIDDFNEQFDVDLPAEDYHTVAGFVFGELGRAAAPRDEVSWDGMRFTVVDVEGSRIERLEVHFERRQAAAEGDVPAEERRLGSGYDPGVTVVSSKEIHLNRIRIAVLATLAALVVAVAAQAATPTLTGTVGPGFTITLTQGGKKVTTLKAGTYTFKIADKSNIHNFHLIGPGGLSKTTSVPFVGNQTWTLTLKKGVYKFQCDPHATIMKGRFVVS